MQRFNPVAPTQMQLFVASYVLQRAAVMVCANREMGF